MGGTKLAPGGTLPLPDFAESWLLSLEAEHKSPQTVRSYRAALEAFLRWHAEEFPLAEPVLDKAAVTAFLADHRRAGRSAATCRLRYAALRRFAAWLHEEGEVGTDALAG